MKPTLSRSNTSGSIISGLIVAVVALSLIGLLGGMGLSFMGGVIKHNSAEAAAAEAETNAPAPAPVVAADEPAPTPKTDKPAKSAKSDKAKKGAATAGGAAIEIATHAMQFLYTVTEFTVKSGDQVKINFKNTSTQVPQPHNLIICKPGKKGTVEAGAMALMTDPNAMAKGYIPESEDIFAHSKLIQPGQEEVVEFTAPEAGTYDYLCTFPGHWILMKGVMTVE